jgi:hypothetical protein
MNPYDRPPGYDRDEGQDREPYVVDIGGGDDERRDEGEGIYRF